MSRVSREWMSRLFLCVALLSVSAFAEEEKVSLNFVNADIDEVVRAVSHITGKNFLLDPRVKGTINIVSATPIPASLAYDTLLSALRMQGFAAVENAGITKVMPEADAKLSIGSSNDLKSSGDKLATRVYILKNESAVQMVPILRPLIAPNNIVVAYPNSNALVVTDYASNLKRIEQIIASIDQSTVEGPVIIPIKYGSALDFASTISRLMQDGNAGASGSPDASQRFVLIGDPRSNSLLLRTDSPARVTRVRDLVAKLDVAGTGPGNMHVVYLKNAEASRIAQTLRDVVSGDTSPLTSSASTALSPPAAASTSSTGSSSTSSSTGAASVGATSPFTSSSSSSSKGSGSGGGIIQADIASNALIITAPDAVYNNLRAVVEMLDVRRAQVYIEALIAEVTSDKTGEFGFQWQALNGVTGTSNQFVGGTNFGTGAGNILTTAANLGTVGQGLNVGVVNGSTTIPGVGTVLNMGALAKLVQNDNKANILSTPNLLTLDNEEAKIVVGENVPFITGSYAQTGTTTTATPFQTIDRKDVGLTLRIKPTILEGGTVKLQIYEEVSSINSLTNPAGIITNTRSLESIVLVDEGHIVVLGGLIQDSVTMQEDKVPVLGDIPWLGNFFRHEIREQTKTNLMIFIHPYVLRTASAPDSMTQDRYDYLRGAQKDNQVPTRAALPDMKAPIMPPLNQKPDSPSGSKTESTVTPPSPKQGDGSKSSATPGLEFDVMDAPVAQLSIKAIAKKIPYPFAKSKGVLLTHVDADSATVSLRADAAPETLAEVQRVLGVPLRASMISVAEFDQALARAYAQAEGSAAAMVEDVEQDMDLSQLVHDLPQTEDLLDAENDAPVIRMINALLTQAVRENASDIHIEPFETRSVVRFRIDGTLKDVIEPHRALHAAMASRIKIMAELDIAEKRLPQDGRITLRLAGRPVDVRVSTLPTGHGERVVLRLLDKDAGRLELSRLGMQGETLGAMDALVKQPHGIVLVTGPTGSGKTTTLYAALSRIDATVTNVMTVEDPIEYDLDGIGQTQVNPRIDMTFARALRAILRQDPDVIMIGEIRDLETAQIAVQASLTGHLVLATLHTNDTVSSVTRLTDMGIEPFLLSSSLLGVLAQRLVRSLCSSCREAYAPSEAELALLEGVGIPDKLYRPKGCAVCGNSGYRGRTGIYELLTVDDGMRHLIHDHAAEQDLRQYALQHGMRGLRQDGMHLVANGVTSLEELLRVTRE